MINDIDQDVDTTLIDETLGRMEDDQDMFGVSDLEGDKVIIDAITDKNVEQSEKVDEVEVSTAKSVTTGGGEDSAAPIIAQISKDELTLAQTLI
ncbi:hypothetical protein Tco_0437294, partial [Tanacetum coccineum]